MSQKKLRAYLYTHHPGSVTRSNSFGDYDELATALGILVSNPDRRFALDVSFGPIEDEDALQSLLSTSPSRILISSSALSVLGGALVVSGGETRTVGSTKFHSLAAGWGYEDAEALAALRQQTTNAPASRGWVAQLQKYDHKLAGWAADAGIWDDDSYVECERQLPPDVRLRMAQTRYYLMCGDRPKAATILDNVRCCPPWVTESKFSNLPLTARQSNVLNANTLRRVADLAPLGSKGLFKLPNLGAKSVRELGQMICDAFLSVPAREQVGVSKSATQPQATSRAESFGALMTHCVAEGQPAEKAVWLHRCGVLGKKHTLREAGITLGLSAERIRQIEAKVIETVRSHEVWDKLRSHLGQLLQDRPGPLFLKDLPQEDAWFVDEPGLVPSVLFAIETYCDGLYFAFALQGDTIISRMSAKDWQRTIADANLILGDRSQKQFLEQRARRLVSALLVDVGAELREPLLECLGLGNQITLQQTYVSRPTSSRGPKTDADEDLSNKLEHELLRRALLKPVYGAIDD